MMASDVKGIRAGGPARPDLSAVAGDAAARAPARAERPAPADDRLSLTGTAALLARAASSLERIPVVNLARVSHVRESLVQGTYEMNPRRIAEKLMRFELMLPEPAYADLGSA
jgi:negative regulator of flagellin synthesis FlgM